MPVRGCSCLGCSGYMLGDRQDWGCLGEPSTWGVLASAFPGGCCCCRAQDMEREAGLGGCQTLPESGEKQQGAASCLGATSTPKGARQEGGGSMDTSSWLAQGEGPSGGETK